MNGILRKRLGIVLLIFFLAESDLFGQLTWDAREKDVIINQMSTTRKINFEFFNNSKSDIEITDIKTSCGCTVAATDKFVYKRSERGVISVEITVKTILTPQKKYILVSLDQQPEPIRLTVILRPFKFIEVSPIKLIWNS